MQMESPEEAKKTTEKTSAELLAEKQRLDELYRQKFTREVTVMFTDLKDSTHLAESLGDMQTRELINVHNSILFPLIDANKGKLVKTMGDGTMSYFERPDDAIRTAVAFQKALAQHNKHKSVKVPILVRCGINTGTGIVEETDIYGDVVNVAARFEAQANASEIYMSESTFEETEEKGEFYCRYIKDVSLKGKSEMFKVYKVFWDELEISNDQAEPVMPEGAKKDEPQKSGIPWRLLAFIVILVGTVFVIMLVSQKFEGNEPEEKRSRNLKVTMAPGIPIIQRDLLVNKNVLLG